MGWYLVITEEMRSMGLSGNELLVYALLNGYSQSEQGCFYGDVSYICEVCGIVRRTCFNILKSLCERGYIIKANVITEHNQTATSYRCANLKKSSAKNAPVQKMHQCKIFQKSSAKNAPNNNIDIYNNSLSNAHAREKFIRPSVDDVRAYCAAAGYDIDAENFCNFYESKGWKVGSAQMKDWQAAVRTWAAREKADPKTKAEGKPRRTDAVDNFHAMKAMLEDTDEDINHLIHNQDEQ